MDAIYEHIVQFKKQGIDMVLVTAVKKEGEGPVGVGKKMLVSETDESFGTVGGGSLELYARKQIKDVFKKRTSCIETYLLNDQEVIKENEAKRLNMVCGGKVTLFYDFIGAKEHIYLFGAGHVAQALVNVLHTMPFYLTVIDDRAFVIDRFNHANRLVHQGFVEFIENEGLKPGSFVIVCTPNHHHDYRVMHKLIEKKLELKYVGMLSSMQKMKDYLEKTYETFGKDLDLNHVYAPIGLDLGGKSPEEIAISISAEILAITHHKKHLKHMREKLDDSLRYWND